MCSTTLGSGGGGRYSKAEIGGGDRPTISIIGGLNLLELPVSLCFYSNMQAKRHFWLQGGLIGKFAIAWSVGAVGRHMLATLKESVPPPPPGVLTGS